MGMYGKGSSPRKQMAMGNAGESLGNPSPYPGSSEHGAKMHPDATARTGEKGAMADSERGIGMPIHHAKDMHPAQAAPMHGTQHEKALGFDRGGKV